MEWEFTECGNNDRAVELVGSAIFSEFGMLKDGS